MAAWVIGDIHGCFESLLALEEAIKNVDPGATFVAVGDLVDRGPDSMKVVEHFCSSDDHTSVMGNHEEFLLRIVRQDRPDLMDGIEVPPWIESTATLLERKVRRSQMAPVADWAVNSRLMWLLQGGAETIESYGGNPADPSSWSFPREHLEWLAARPLVWEDDAVVVTHALVNANDLGILRDSAPTPREIAGRTLWSRSLPREAPDPDKIHVSGHTVRPRVIHDPRRRLVQLDTGAYMAGRLTAYCAALDAVTGVVSDVTWEMA